MQTRRWLRQFYLVWGALGVCLLIAACGAAGVGKGVEVSLDGEVYENAGASIVDDQVMVPLRFLERAFGVQISWSEEAEHGEEAGAGREAAGTTAGIGVGEVAGTTEESDDGETGAAIAPVYYSDRVAVLMYHHIMEEPTQDNIVSVDQFEGQMGLLRSEGFRVIGWEQYRAFMLEGASVPDNAVLLTFDDGYASFYEHAFPILQEYGYPAVNFIIVSTIDTPNPHSIPKLGWDQMREMQAAGIAFLNHSYDLHRNGVVDSNGKERPLTTGLLYLEREGRTETIEEYKQRVKADLSLAERRLHEELGNRQGALAFPYGVFDGKLLEVLDELDIGLSFTVAAGINGRNDRIGRRLNAGRSDKEPEAIIGELKTVVDNYTDRHGNKGRITIAIDGEPANFSKVLQGSDDSGPLVLLREFCESRNIGVEWNSRDKRIDLTVS